jgi:hypothetical protein
MAKRTEATIHQKVELQNKGIEIAFWNDDTKGGRLVVKKATIEWYEANAKTPTWTGTWEELATALSRTARSSATTANSGTASGATPAGTSVRSAANGS